MEIEAIYLYGEFGVKTQGKFEQLDREAVRCNNQFELVAKPTKANLAKIQEADLPFFAGTVRLSREFTIEGGEECERYLIFERQKTISSKITINDQLVSTFLWKPFMVKLDGILKAGTNKIEIELTNSLRNMLGPHHLEEGESYTVGPFSFYKEDNGVFARNWTGESNCWNDDYSIVEFGIDGLKII